MDFQQATATRDESGDRPLNGRLFDHTPIGMAVYRLEDPEDDRSLRLVAWNPVAERLTGLSGDDLIGRTIDEILPQGRERTLSGTEQDDLPALLAGVVRAGVVEEVDEYVYRDDRLVEKVWFFRAFPLPDRRVGVAFEDVTEHRRLQDSRARMSDILQATSDLVMIATLDGRIVDRNPVAGRMLGLAGRMLGLAAPDLSAADAAEGASLWTALSEEWSERLREEAIPAAMQEGTWRGEVTFRSRSGCPIHASTVLIAHEARGSAAPLISVIARDISGEKQLEEQLLQSQKMEAIGRLAGGVAHDFNNLITAILGHTEILADGLSDRPSLREEAVEIRRVAERAGELTRQMLTFGRPESPRRRRVDLNATVRELDRMLRRVIGEDIRLVSRCHPDRLPVLADAAQLGQVIVNLAVNARDAMPDGGDLRVETAAVTVDGRAAERLAIPRGAYATLEVSDTGVGMDEATRSRIFEPFFTTKGAARGTGLGLSTAYAIVAGSDGHVRVNSEPGAGTRFRIYLPLVSNEGLEVEDEDVDDFHGEGRANENGSVSMSNGREADRAATILVAEDEDAVRNIIVRILQSQGHVVLESSDWEMAVEVAERHEGSIDLLIADVMMPEQRGTELARRLRELRPGIGVLYISGYEPEEVTDRDTDVSGHFLRKPFTTDGLGSAVATILAERESSPA